MTFEHVSRVADAVLLEGYILYPYRATSSKNRYRWSFGVLAPRSWSEAAGGDPWAMKTQILASGDAPSISGRLRFLSIVPRRVEALEGERFVPAEAVEIDGETHLAWEEGVLHEIDFDAGAPGLVRVQVAATEETTLLRDRGGRVRARVVRTQAALEGALRVAVEDAGAPRGEAPIARITVRVENLTGGVSVGAPRSEAMPRSFASTHLLFRAHGGRFLSLLDPPPFARPLVEACRGQGSFPVLAGEDGRDDVILASPIILYDHPRIAPESTGDFFDACEIDELLALRTRTLTPEEKAFARATDPRAAAIVDRADAMTPEELARLHGARRDEARYQPGARVRLRPGETNRRTDAQDVLYCGRPATVRAIRTDFDGREYLCVTLDDDPAADLLAQRGLFFHYYPDEVEPLPGVP